MLFVRRIGWVVLLACASRSTAAAQERPSDGAAGASPAAESAAGEDLASSEELSGDALDGDSVSADDAMPTYRVAARVDAAATEDGAGRTSTVVTRDEMAERLARSAPDALRYVPGVSVQQTAHGQASPFVRGVTGQQVLIVYDGVRMNNGVYRQGPNQYFFTVDAQSLAQVEVVRGSASTRYGADALGGAILARPAEPTIDRSRDGLTVHARGVGRFGSQDLDLGGRAEVEAQIGRQLGVLVGFGYRATEQLQGSGVLTNPADGLPTRVPYIEADRRTQRGTGYRYGVLDARIVYEVTPELRAIAFLNGFRQFDSPRTDQCPAAFAPEHECLVFREQFRTMAGAALRGDAGPELRDVDVTFSYQRQHEWRELDRPASYVRNDARDDVDTYGASARGATRSFHLGDVGGHALRLTARGGADLYLDRVASQAAITFTDVMISRAASRGQYVDGAEYFTGGVWAEAELELGAVRARVGGRYGVAGARAAGDEASGSTRVDQRWDALVGRAGVEWRASREVLVYANVDQGFRPPNLDDLTSRQVIGPGFQFENPYLVPERSVTYEVGTRLRFDSLSIDAAAYVLTLDGAMQRASRQASDCPAMTPSCGTTWTRFQLVNLDGTAWIFGTELAARVALTEGLLASATVAYTIGEGPNPQERPADPAAPYVERMPLSRIPPLNGNVELRYAHPETRLVIGAALRWAAAQDRLAESDLSDARIPIGGTPAYAAFDLRAGWRFENHLSVNAVFENVFDQVYRVHGSSINGAGRGLVVQVEGTY